MCLSTVASHLRLLFSVCAVGATRHIPRGAVRGKGQEPKWSPLHAGVVSTTENEADMELGEGLEDADDGIFRGEGNTCDPLQN